MGLFLLNNNTTVDYIDPDKLWAEIPEDKQLQLDFYIYREFLKIALSEVTQTAEPKGENLRKKYGLSDSDIKGAIKAYCRENNIRPVGDLIRPSTNISANNTSSITVASTSSQAPFTPPRDYSKIVGVHYISDTTEDRIRNLATCKSRESMEEYINLSLRLYNDTGNVHVEYVDSDKLWDEIPRETQLLIDFYIYTEFLNERPQEVNLIAEPKGENLRKKYGFVDKIVEKAMIKYCSDNNISLDGGIDIPASRRASNNISTTSFGRTRVEEANSFSSGESDSDGEDLSNIINRMSAELNATNQSRRNSPPPYSGRSQLPMTSTSRNNETSPSSDRKMEVSNISTTAAQPSQPVAQTSTTSVSDDSVKLQNLLKDLEAALFNSVAQDTIENAIILNCGHSIGQDDLAGVTSGNQPKCPLCRTRITNTRQVTPNYMLRAVKEVFDKYKQPSP